MLECDHCGNSQQIEGSNSAWRGQAVRELDFRKAVRDGLSDFEMAEIQTFACVNCGAHVEFDANAHSAECPFCATPVVGETGAERQIKPRGLLPFGLKEKDARDRMNDWLGQLWFAPNGLRAYARKGRRMQGIYVPYWTYDADTKSRYSGQRGTIYYESQTYYATVNGRRQRRTRRVQKISWKNVRGRVAEYLAGFRAEGYTVSLEDGYQEATAYVNRMIERDVKFDIGGDRQRISGVDTEIGTLTFKHVLLPVWLAAYKYRGKTYRFVVNGRTGAVQGERPYSGWKIFFAVLFGLLIAGGLGYLFAQGQANGSFTIQRY